MIPVRRLLTAASAGVAPTDDRWVAVDVAGRTRRSWPAAFGGASSRSAALGLNCSRKCGKVDL